ncbi:putative deoxycholate-binding periplasmic protein YgiS [Alphaproteobacteria bacterium SO-S41]|nr:putative deoxycholate-binding periplasmic protein YgiS [Alphaproteobacteria bacterium SO-S41]
MRRLASLLAFALALTWAAAGAEGVLRRANGNEPGTLDPQKFNLLSEDNIMRDLFEGLTTQDADNAIIPGQAESWTVSDDGKVWTFKLRAGLVWSDGEPVTADDFVAGARRAVDPAIAAPLPDSALKLLNARAILAGTMKPDQLGIAAPDPLTVVLTLEAPSPLLPKLLAEPLLMPLPRHAYAKYGDAGWAKPGNMVSNGPYTLSVWEPSSEVRVVKNPRFRNADAVAIPEVVFYPSDDQEMALKRFRAGEIDLVAALPAARLEWARTTMPEALSMTPVTQIRYIEFNYRRPEFQDARVRRALAMLVDREVIANNLMLGSVAPAYGFVPRCIAGYEGTLFDFGGETQAARVVEAKRLLAEAGYDAAHPLTVELRTLNESWAKPVAVAVAAMWQSAGVDATTKLEEGRSHYAALKASDFDVAMSAWFANDDPEQFMWLYQSGGGINDSKYANPAFDALTHDAEQTMDMAERYRKYAAAEKMLMDEAVMIPLFWTIQATLVAPNVTGLKATAVGMTRSEYARMAE